MIAMESITQLEGRDMPSSEELNDAYSCRNQPSLGMVFLLASSLIQGGSGLPSLVGVKPQSAEAATLEDATAPTKNKRAQGKAVRQANSRETSKKKVIRGQASWYGPGFHGKKTASGEIFDQGRLTAAHKTLPLGTKAKVTNLENGNSVEVEINDRGPYVGDRVIDLSRAAANALGFVESGLTLVRIEPLYQEASSEEAG
ncbi:MAG TPA: septal ring lytic transglycosylase RlpA family protein [Candidatus Binatia bacterium]|nr:septal ring lytic transglycosylase RlpA family protein [Candidatus Binatia bacterium]